MPKLGPLQIPVHLLDAIRDDRLVIFAGAGVSVGHPANLPDFADLAFDIAKGTGIALKDNESVDHFLGRLQYAGVEVHSEVAKRLSDSSSAPTALHHDLVRIFRNPESVRLVTTNFDVHFEAAVETLYGRSSEVYYAPALPLARNFRGLVHVHGALTRPSEMVVTDADFGRAYLTEGWARRFLLELVLPITSVLSSPIYLRTCDKAFGSAGSTSIGKTG